MKQYQKMKLINKIKNYSAKKIVLPLAMIVGLSATYETQAQTRREIEKSAKTFTTVIKGLEAIFGTNQQKYPAKEPRYIRYVDDQDIDGDGDLDFIEITQDNLFHKIEYAYIKLTDRKYETKKPTVLGSIPFSKSNTYTTYIYEHKDMDGDGDLDIKKTIIKHTYNEKEIYIYENEIIDGKRQLLEERKLGTVIHR